MMPLHGVSVSRSCAVTEWIEVLLWVEIHIVLDVRCVSDLPNLKRLVSGMNSCVWPLLLVFIVAFVKPLSHM